jgi:hypothetical protein
MNVRKPTLARGATLELDIPLLLPEAPDAADTCTARLLAELTGREGVTWVHVLVFAVQGKSVQCSDDLGAFKDMSGDVAVSFVACSNEAFFVRGDTVSPVHEYECACGFALFVHFGPNPNRV